MDAAPLSMLPVGHSFITRLANYTLVSGTMNLGLNEGDCQVAFFARSGLTLRKIVPLTDEVSSRQPDVVFLEIGCNEIDRVAPFVLAEQVCEFAKMLVARGVRQVIVSQFFFRDSARSRYHVVSNFNDLVTQYNQRMNSLWHPQALISGDIMVECGRSGANCCVTEYIIRTTECFSGENSLHKIVVNVTVNNQYLRLYYVCHGENQFAGRK